MGASDVGECQVTSDEALLFDEMTAVIHRLIELEFNTDHSTTPGARDRIEAEYAPLLERIERYRSDHPVEE